MSLPTVASLFISSDFTAIKHLHDNNIISKDSVIVNGQSGDLFQVIIYLTLIIKKDTIENIIFIIISSIIIYGINII